MFYEVKPDINLIGGTLSGDDTVIEKPYSDPDKTELIEYFWSGKSHRPVKGINLITLYYTDPKGFSVPVNYRIYNKQEEKTKNDYFREMVTEVLDWGLKPLRVTGDSWYSSRENLTFLKNKELGFLMGIAKNRKVSISQGLYVQVQELEIPDSGIVVHLKKFGQVKVFRKTFKNERDRYYIMYLNNSKALAEVTRREFKELHSIHWGIECYHRALKQLCGVGQFMVRTTDAILNHFFCSIRAFTQLELMRTGDLIENWYEVQRNLYIQIAREFIIEHLKPQVGGHAHNLLPVNA